jgi:alanine dehydrogenase
MDNKPLSTEEIGIKTLEKRLIKSESHQSLNIGLPKEISNDECRISLTPGGVSVLSERGHHIFIEQQAGEQASFPDQEYIEAGAEISLNREDLYTDSEIILKVAPPVSEELALFDDDHILFSALHLGNTSGEFLQQLMHTCRAAIGYEFIENEDGEFPIVRMMHEITGSMSVQIAAHYLEKNDTGHRGIMLGGISGIPPATVVILGAGITAEYAARTALGYGAQVFVMDDNLTKLRHIDEVLGRRVITATANRQYIASALEHADVVIGAAMAEGEQAPVLVTKSMVANMKPGSVIVDTVIDQGGCIATSRLMNRSQPIFIECGVIHYCLPNIPSNVGRTATYALNNVIAPFMLALGEAGGLEECVWQNTALRNGTYLYKNNLTKDSLSELFDLPYRDIDMLIASQI